MTTVEEITPQAMVSWPCRTTPSSVCTMEASLGRPSPNACNVQPWRLCTSPAVTLALLREPSSGSFPQLGSGGPWCSPQVGTPTTSCPLTCHRPSDAVTWPGGQVPAPDTSSGNTPPFPALTCHWIRTEEVVCGVTETKLGGSPRPVIQERRKRGLPGSACTWLPVWRSVLISCSPHVSPVDCNPHHRVHSIEI